MSQIYYTCLTGLMAANYGLQNSSNNLANMQSPGFKRSDVFYAALGDEAYHDGLGVSVKGQRTNFSDGHYLSTDSASDLAIIGQGYFIVKLKNGEYVYTRDGQFSFNDKGLLIDQASGGEVLALNDTGNLAPIHQKGPESSKGQATNTIYLKGKFYYSEYKKDDTDPSPEPPDPMQGKFDPITFNLNNVYDKQGKAHTVKVTLKCLPPENNEQQWTLDNIECDDITATFDPQSIEFNSTTNGLPNTKQNTFSFTLNGEQTVTINFGDYLKDSDKAVELNKKSTNLDTTDVDILKQDGFGEGRQIGFSFDETGQIQYQYDNGQTVNGVHIALARFDDEDRSLVPGQNNVFHAKSTQNRTIGRANSHGLGTIKSKQIESANVDSTMEFGNIVVLQRMFQACSQLMDIDKQLLDKLEEK